MANRVDAVYCVIVREIVLVISCRALAVASGKEGVFRVLCVIDAVHACFDEILVCLLRVSHLSMPSDHRPQGEKYLTLTFNS